MKNRHQNNPRNKQAQSTKNKDAKRLYDTLFSRPKSRRMAATDIGYTDQTYMVTQQILDWIEDGTAQVVGVIKCSRSKRIVQAVTTNPNHFVKPNYIQGKLFK